MTLISTFWAARVPWAKLALLGALCAALGACSVVETFEEGERTSRRWSFGITAMPPPPPDRTVTFRGWGLGVAYTWNFGVVGVSSMKATYFGKDCVVVFDGDAPADFPYADVIEVCHGG